MISSAKNKGAKVWLNTNGSMFGPDKRGLERLESIINSGVDMIEFSMDAADALTYSKLRPPISGLDPRTNEKRWEDQVNNVRNALKLRNQKKETTTNIVVSMIRQKELGDVESAERFWREEENSFGKRTLIIADNDFPIGQKISSHFEKIDFIKDIEISIGNMLVRKYQVFLGTNP